MLLLLKKTKEGIAIGQKALSLKSRKEIFLFINDPFKYLREIGRSSFKRLTNKSL